MRGYTEARHNTHRVRSWALAGLGLLGLSGAAAAVGNMTTTDEGRGEEITECPVDYPGMYREVWVEDRDILRILADSAREHKVVDTFAKGGLIVGIDIANLDGENACSVNTTDGTGAYRDILLPSGLEALNYIMQSERLIDPPKGLSEEI